MTKESKNATTFTRKYHARFLEYLNFEDKQDFEDANRGLIASFENKIQDLNMIDGPSPDAVNPSLWRNTQLQAKSGLYKVVEGIYQVRGLSLATMIFIEGESGVIVIDTMFGTLSAKAAMELYYSHRSKKPVSAIIISQSHVDHYNGAKSILEYADNDNIPIIVPKHFTKEVFSENVMLGPIMNRRTGYQLGFGLPVGDKGYVNAGIGSIMGDTQSGFIMPTREIKNELEEVEIDGITFQFLLALNTEAPSEMHCYIKNYKTLYVSENANKTMHQLYTIRGAKTRDALEWVKAIDKTIGLFDENEIAALVMAHAWPVWGEEQALEHLKLQRDLYKYIHDQTIRLANNGFTMDEIAEYLKLPNALGKYWGNREYYGTLKQNCKAVYNFYLGYYSGNPSDLDPLPEVESGKKYIKYMGGIDNILELAKSDYEKGEYRWVSQVLKHVVMVDPKNRDVRELLADSYEQLGYQTESANWRNAYLVGANELRNIATIKAPTAQEGMPSSRMIRLMPFEEFFKLLSVKLNGSKAEGKKIIMNITFLDLEEDYAIYLENSVLNKANKLNMNPNVALKTDKSTFYSIVLGELTVDRAISSNDMKVIGEHNKLNNFLMLLDDYKSPIHIVTP